MEWIDDFLVDFWFLLFGPEEPLEKKKEDSS